MSTKLTPVRALAALALANARYWSGLAGHVRDQLRHWQRRAEAIDDPRLRALALAKLQEESFNAQAAAVLATLAPRAHRRAAARAIVALELLYDCLDGLTEQPGANGERLFAAYLAAVDLGAPLPADAASNDAYLTALAAAVRTALADLPAYEAVAPVAARAAARGAQAQTLMHAAAHDGHGQLSGWARAEAHGGELPWREYLAGAAASVLALHALIAVAADPRTTTGDAERIDRAYASICAVTTLLDCVVDQSSDAGSGELAYITLYDDPRLISLALARTAADAVRRCGELPSGSHHLMTLAGAIAYWSSDPAAREQPAAAALAPLQRELRALIAPPLVLMRGWRAARRLKARHGRSTVAVDSAPC